MTPRPRPIDILCSLSRHTGLHPSLILDARCRVYHAERAVYATLLRRCLGYSLNEIAREIGFARHTSVISSLETYQQSMSLVNGDTPSSTILAVMSDLDRDKPPCDSAKVYRNGRCVELRSLLNGSVQLTSTHDETLDMVCANAMDALDYASAWLDAQHDASKDAA